MAENAAHITFSTQTKPSLFEVIAQESLAELIRPAFRRIVEVWHSRNPEQCHWLYNWFEEIFCVMNSILQYHYLSFYGGSFAESLYGLRRVPVIRKISTSRTSHHYLSFLSIVLIPYLNAKTEQFVKKFHLSNQSEEQKQILIFTYRLLQAAWQGATFVQYILYMTGRSYSHSLLLRMLGIYLCYKTEQDNTWKVGARSAEIWPILLRNAASYGLEIFAFFLQALQWWLTEGTKNTFKSDSFPPPPPPEVTQISKGISTCPICKHKLKIETVLVVSGYVFCYRCIREGLRIEKKCPVTGLPATFDDLIRIYYTK